MMKKDDRTIFEVKQDMLNRLELTRSALMDELGVEFDANGYRQRIEAVSIAHSKENADELAAIAEDIIEFINEVTSNGTSFSNH